MRGKRGMIRQGGLYFRIIPAHAGQTRATPGRVPPAPDHPRACGANSLWSHSRAPVGGSSPRMRGKLHALSLRELVKRIIPAHAGQTRATPGRVPPAPDHPRACGANTVGLVSHLAQCGSSPRMRGKPAGGAPLSVPLRIIPAHAGQTRAPPRCRP